MKFLTCLGIKRFQLSWLLLHTMGKLVSKNFIDCFLGTQAFGCCLLSTTDLLNVAHLYSYLGFEEAEGGYQVSRTCLNIVVIACP